MKSLLPLFCLVVSMSSVAACAPENQIQPRTAANEQGMVCTRERPTGSSISKRVCRPKGESTALNQNTRMLENNSRAAGAQGIAAGR